MTSGRCSSFAELPEPVRSLVAGARRAVLGTIDAQGRPHLVPITFALRGPELVTAIDHKPKAGLRPARLRNLERDPRVTVLVDRYDDHWVHLGWVMVRGSARIEPPGSATDALAVRYPQYRAFPPPGPVIAVVPAELLWWTWT